MFLGSIIVFQNLLILKGHAICTGIAVIGGKYISDKISERKINFIGSLLFLFFGF